MAGKVKNQPSFEEQLARLTSIVEKMEAGTLTLDEQLALYKEGMELSAELSKRLEATNARLIELGEEKDGARSAQQAESEPPTLLDGLEEA